MFRTHCIYLDLFWSWKFIYVLEEIEKQPLTPLKTKWRQYFLSENLIIIFKTQILLENYKLTELLNFWLRIFWEFMKRQIRIYEVIEASINTPIGTKSLEEWIPLHHRFPWVNLILLLLLYGEYTFFFSE